MIDNFNIVHGLLILSIPIILLIIKHIIYNKKKKIVLKHSNLIKTIKYINSNYEFKTIENTLHKVLYKAKSKKQLDDITSNTILLEYIDNNTDNIRTDIENVIYDIALLDEYNDEVKSLCDNMKHTEYKDINISKEDFNKIEDKIIKKILLDYTFELNCLIKIYYVTPKKKNKYIRKEMVTLDYLIDIYDKWVGINNYKQTKEYERSKMSNSLRYDILRRDNFRCKICGATQDDGVKLHVDHIIPVAKGGKTEPSNLRTLCEDCNRGKSDKIE